MTQLHNYEEVPWRQQRLGHQEGVTLPKKTFLPPSAADQTSFDMRGIVTEASRKASWLSPNPASYSVLHAELAAMAFAMESDEWAQLQDSWLCLLMTRGMLVRHRGWDTSWFALGASEGGHLSCFKHRS